MQILGKIGLKVQCFRNIFPIGQKIAKFLPIAYLVKIERNIAFF
jgi:hypothetical protein